MQIDATRAETAEEYLVRIKATLGLEDDQGFTKALRRRVTALDAGLPPLHPVARHVAFHDVLVRTFLDFLPA